MAPWAWTSYVGSARSVSYTTSRPPKSPIASWWSYRGEAPNVPHFRLNFFSFSVSLTSSFPSRPHTWNAPVFRAYAPSATNRAVPGIHLWSGRVSAGGSAAPAHRAGPGSEGAAVPLALRRGTEAERWR